MAPRTGTTPNQPNTPGSNDQPKVLGGPEKPKGFGKIEDWHLIMKKIDDDGIRTVEALAIPEFGVVLTTTKVFKKELGFQPVQSTVFIPKGTVEKDAEGNPYLWQHGMGGIR